MNRRPIAVALIVGVAGLSIAGTALAAAGVVSMRAAKRSVTYPGVVDLIATGTGTETLARFERSTSPTNTLSWETLESRATVGVSAFRVPHLPRRNAYYRAVIGGVESTPAVYVAVRVPMSAPRLSSSRPKAGTRLRVSGTVRPNHPLGMGAEAPYRFGLEFDKRTKSGSWKTQSSRTALITAEVDSDTSRWSGDRLLKRGDAGLWRVRAFHECPNHARSYSAWREFSVRP